MAKPCKPCPPCPECPPCPPCPECPPCECPDPIDPPDPPVPEPELIYATDLHYQGCFRLPAYPARYDWPTKGLAYHPANHSLFVVGHSNDHGVGEVSIPTPVKGALTLNDLPRAVELQAITDPTEGSWYALAYGGGICVGGLLVHEGRLITTAYRYYDAEGSQPSSHWSRNLDLSRAGDYVGPVPLEVTDLTATAGVHAGHVSGQMGVVAPEWRAAFHGPAFTGQCGIPIISRTSFGPALFSFDPADIGVKRPVPTTALLFYTGSYATLGPYSPGEGDHNPNPLFNATLQIGGVVQVIGSRAVLCFGVIGIGKYAYGEGTADPTLDGQPVPGTDGHVVYCYDPVVPGKGEHAYPYEARVWAYDANDLAKVAAGTLMPWDPVPYACWTLSSDFYSWLPRLSGAAYDPDSQRIYVSQTNGDGDAPLIHVYQCAMAAQRAGRARTRSRHRR